MHGFQGNNLLRRSQSWAESPLAKKSLFQRSRTAEGAPSPRYALHDGQAPERIETGAPWNNDERDRRVAGAERQLADQAAVEPEMDLADLHGLAPFEFDAIYGHYFDRIIATGAKAILQASVERYIAAINGAYEGN